MLFVGPHQPYLAYVADVLPSLGEEGVQTCTLRDLLPEGAAATAEADPDVARLKSSADLVQAIEAAVRFYEQPPAKGMTVETDWSDIWLSADDWAEAFEAPEPGTPHNEARVQILDALVTILRDGGSHLNYSVYHDRYQRTPDGWKFSERVDEVRYLDTTPLTGSPPLRRGRLLARRPGTRRRKESKGNQR